MTEGELIQAAQATWANVLTLLTIQITLLTGYIVVAYLAGKELAKSQVTIVNALYLLLTTFVMLSVYSLSNRATEMATVSIEISQDRVLGPQIWLPLGVVAIFTFCLLASLKFMWDVRHPKTE